jgi:NADH dehydrogenase
MNLQVGSGSEPRVLIIGGGFGGLAAAKSLRKQPVNVIVIDKTNHHLFQPLLYQVATSTLSSSDIATPIRQILRNQKNATVFLGDVTSIDLRSRTFFVDNQKAPVPYDFLIFATGAEQSYFGRSEFAPFAPGLKTLADAEYLRNRVLGAFERAEEMLDPAAHPELLTFVLVGGGPSGVELASALCDIARRTLASEFRRYDPTKLRVILVQSGPRILPQFPEKLSQKAADRLKSLGVEVRTNSKVTNVDADGVLIGNEKILSKNVIWTAGVAASSLGRSLGLPSDKSGRIIVQKDCSVADYPEVFIIGDAASFITEGGKPLPGVAQVALQQGKYVGELIGRRLAKQPAPPPFRYFDKGNLAVVGPFFAVMDAFGLRWSGLPAFLVWIFVHIQFLASNLSRFRTGGEWLWMLLTNQRAGCLIVTPKQVGAPSDSKSEVREERHD